MSQQQTLIKVAKVTTAYRTEISFGDNSHKIKPYSYYRYSNLAKGIIEAQYDPIGKLWGLPEIGIRAHIKKCLNIDVACGVIYSGDKIRVLFIPNHAFTPTSGKGEITSTAIENFKQTIPGILNDILTEFLDNPNGNRAYENFFDSDDDHKPTDIESANQIFKDFLRSEEVKRLFGALRGSSSL